MMDEICYTLAVRQRTCQNGISRKIDNVYTNVNTNSIVPLSFGYQLKIIQRCKNFVTIQISNSNTIPNLIFNIPNGGYKIFDLPKESGTLKIFVGATGIDCGESVVCCKRI
ncbi:MAG: hypothetical protein RSE00_02200 [Clostridia bacterium]